MTRKLCICQICNCGRHHCPHRDSGNPLVVDSTVPCLMTEYDARFKGEMVSPPTSYKPHTGYRLPETEMEKTSTQHSDYVEKPLAKVENYKPKRAYEEPTDAMDLNSSYNTVYLGKQGKREASFKPTNRKIGGGIFRGDATYQVDYKHWPNSQRKLMAPEPYVIDNSVKFGNPTEFQSRYVNLHGKAADSMKAPQEPFLCPIPFDSRTTQQMDYDLKAIPDKYQRPVAVYQPPTIPVDGNTIYHTTYKGEPAEKVHSYKPANPAYRYDGSPLNRSTQQTDFVQHQLPDKYQRKLLDYEASDIPMDLHTTSQIEYDGKKGPPATPLRPTNRRLGGALFRGDTTNHTDYKHWADARRKPIVPEAYVPLAHPFAAISEFQSSYQGLPAKPADSMRPPLQTLPPAPWLGVTSYALDFNSAKDYDCPVEHLKENFAFVENRQHDNFYTPLHPPP